MEKLKYQKINLDMLGIQQTPMVNYNNQMILNQMIAKNFGEEYKIAHKIIKTLEKYILN